MTDTLPIIDSAKHIAITRNGQNVGELVFNPEDVLFAEKFYKLIGEFEGRYGEYQTRARALDADKRKDANGLPANLGEQIALTKEACTFAYVQIDTLFGIGTSAMVFGDAMVPDAILQFLSGIAPYVRRARAEKVQKYTNMNTQ